MPTATVSSLVNRNRHTFLPAVFFCFALAICGCGGGGGSKAVTDAVKGKVTLNGQAVSGKIVLLGVTDKKEHATPLALNGDFIFEKLPKGKYQVMVQSGAGAAATVVLDDKAKAKLKMDSSLPSSSSGGAEPPAKYGKPGNDLKDVDYNGGELVVNFELTP
jgi:hypothetical protein